MTAKRILIIDDEDLIRISTQLCLEETAGWEVLTASSGSEGLMKAETEQPDAIFLDVMMPDIDGPTTFKKLQANPATQRIPVFLLTAKAQSSEQRQFAQLGVAGVIPKPFAPMSLAKQVAEVLGWSI
ncbi:MAG: response regulator [Microcoleus sp.]